MIPKQFIFWLLSSTPLIQVLADHRSELIPNEHQLPCDRQIAWFKNITRQTKKLYNEYSTVLANTSLFHVKNDQKMLEISRRIQTGNEQFEHTAAELLEKYESDTKKLHVISNSAARLAFCSKETEWYKLSNTNLTIIATALKSNVLNLLVHVGVSVSKDVEDDFDNTLSRLVSFLNAVNLSKNLFKDVPLLVRRSLKAAKDRIALEKERKVNLNELEPARDVVADYDYDNFKVDDNGLEETLNENFDHLENNLDLKAAEEVAAEPKTTEAKPGEDIFQEAEIEPFECPVATNLNLII